MVLFLLMMLVCSSSAWAQTSASDSWFVRPASECRDNGDGTSYECATLNGGPGAFNSLASINWTPVTGVDGGDTLYICGAHFIELRPLGKPVFPSVITISGACPGDVGSIDTTGIASHTTDAIRLEGDGVEGYTIQDLSVKGARHGILVHAAIPKKGFTIQRVIFDQTKSYTRTNACHALSFAGLASWNYTYITVKDNVFLGTVCGNTLNDAIHLEKALHHILIEGNHVSGPGMTAAIDLSGLSTGDFVITRNIMADAHVGIRIEGSLGCTRDLLISENQILSYTGWGMTLIDVSNSIIANNIVRQRPGASVSYGPPYGAVVLDDLYSCGNKNNVFVGNVFESNYVLGPVVDYKSTYANFVALNVFTANILRNIGTSRALITFRSDTANNVTIDNHPSMCQFCP